MIARTVKPRTSGRGSHPMTPREAPSFDQLTVTLPFPDTVWLPVSSSFLIPVRWWK